MAGAVEKKEADLLDGIHLPAMLMKGPFWALPLVGAVSGLSTIYTCYELTRSNGHLPPGVATPPISFLGAQEPEHSAYQLGFGLTGLLFASVIHVWYSVLYPILVAQKYSQCAFFGIGGLVFACVGATGQGLVTFEEHILEKISDPSSDLLPSRCVWL